MSIKIRNSVLTCSAKNLNQNPSIKILALQNSAKRLIEG